MAAAATPYSATNREIYLWGIGGMAETCLYLMFANISLIYMTGFKLRPELVGCALAFPRIIDAVLDPFIGHYSDNLKTRWGRRRPIIFVSTVLGSFVSMAMWWPSPAWNEYLLFAYLLVFSTLIFTLYGSFSMTHTALGYELSEDPHVRTKIVAVRFMFMAVTSCLLGGWLYWLALRPAFGNEITGIRWVSAGWALILFATGLTPAIFCEERASLRPRQRKPPLIPALKTVFRNKSMRVLVIYRIFQTLGESLYNMQFAPFIMIYYVCNGDKSTATWVAGFRGWIGFMLVLAMACFAQQLSRKISKRRGIIMGAGAAVVSAAILPFILIPDHPYLTLAPLFVLGPILSVGGLFLSAIVPDVCDMDELENGVRREGLITAVLQFINKLENSVCVLISGLLLMSTGYNQNLVQQPQAVLDKMRLFAFAPLIFFSIVCFFIALTFPFSEEMMADVRKRLEERKAQKKLEQASQLQPEPTGVINKQDVSKVKCAPAPAV